VTVRPLTRANFAQALEIALTDTHQYGTIPVKDSLSRCILYKNPLPLLIYLDETVVGFALLTSHRDGVKMKSLIIDPAHRGKGIATPAIKSILRIAQTNVHLSVHPDNHAAIHVYEKNGFRRYDNNKTGKPPHWVYMRYDYATS
jgi:RimJ/RimL family protein N-acetyltransferase